LLVTEVAMSRAVLFVAAASLVANPARGDDAASRAGALADPNFFPLAVWVQNPSRAAEYKKAGINTYVGLWNGPTESQLAELDKHGMKVVCHQNKVGLAHKNKETIIAWMHGDEPDNAQPLGKGKKGWGPPIAPSKIVEDYKKLKATDPARPVLLNLGQGVAWDGWIGRGVRTNHPEDYPEYVKGADILSFDIYPASHDHKDVAGKLWLVADGVTRLRKWSNDRKTVWNCIETTRISNEKAVVTPEQVRAEVWMSLVRGSKGIIYFCHQFKPRFIEAGLLAEKEILAAVTKTNDQIQKFAPVLNSPTVSGGVRIESPADRPVEVLCKKHGGVTYLFAVAMRGKEASATIHVPGAPDGSLVEAIDEDRTIPIREGRFTDDFAPWGVHLYRVATK
jgi:hypothetical protein